MRPVSFAFRLAAGAREVAAAHARRQLEARGRRRVADATTLTAL
jgi:hypothetical protein